MPRSMTQAPYWRSRTATALWLSTWAAAALGAGALPGALLSAVTVMAGKAVHLATMTTDSSGHGQHNTATPPRVLAERPALTWRHSLVWTLSSDDVLFGNIAAVKLLSDGVLAVADRQLGQVLLITPDGSVQQILLVMGEGPGRVNQLAGICELPPDRLLLTQTWPGRVEVVRRDGTPIRSLVLGGRGGQTGVTTLLSFACAHGLQVGIQVNVRFLDHARSLNIVRLSYFDSDLVPVADVLKRERMTVDRMGLVDETEMDVPIHAWNIVDERHVIVAPHREDYRLELHGLDGGLREAFSRDLAPLPRPQSEIDRLMSEFSLEVDGKRRAIEFIYFETAQMIKNVAVLDPQTLLLLTAYCFDKLPTSITARLDLVDLAQTTVREVHLSIPIDPDRDRLLALPNRDLVLLVGGAASFVRHLSDPSGVNFVPAIEYWRFKKELP